MGSCAARVPPHARIWGRGGRAARSQQSSARSTLRNRPARLRRQRDGPDTRALTRSRPARQAAPAPATARPHPHPGQSRTRRAEQRAAPPRSSPRQNEEERGAGRSPSSPPGPAPFSTAAETGGVAPLLAPVRPGPRPPQPCSLAPEAEGSSARGPSACTARLIRAAPWPPPPQRVGPAGPSGAGGRVRAWRRAAAGPEQAASLERLAGLPLLQATELASPPVSEFPGTRRPSRGGPASATHRGL